VFIYTNFEELHQELLITTCTSICVLLLNTYYPLVLKRCNGNSPFVDNFPNDMPIFLGFLVATFDYTLLEGVLDSMLNHPVTMTMTWTNTAGV